MARKAYSMDDQWNLLEPLLPPALSGGRPWPTDLRAVMNTLLYQSRTGCQCDLMPHDLVPKRTAYEYFAGWRDSGVWQEVLDVLRGVVRFIEADSQELDPSEASIDSQTVKTTEPGGDNGGKSITGRKRQIAVDSLGLRSAVLVTSAVVDDARAAPPVCEQLTLREHPRLEVVWVDAKYHNHALYRWLSRECSMEWRLDIFYRPREARASSSQSNTGSPNAPWPRSVVAGASAKTPGAGPTPANGTSR